MQYGAIQYQTWETTFLPTEAPEDPYRDGFLRVEITDPYGDLRWREGFWDGGAWRLRWMPLEDGPHHLRIETNLGGLPDSLGIVVQPSRPQFPPFRHESSVSGPLQIAADRTRFSRHDGTPFFLKCDEVHDVAFAASEAEWTHYIQRRYEQGFNAVRFSTESRASLEGYRYSLEENGWLSGTPDLTLMATVDRRISQANAKGLVAILELFSRLQIYNALDDPNTHEADLQGVLSLDDAVRLGRYCVARWGAYEIAWLLGLSGDVSEDVEYVLDTVTAGRAIFGDDPWRAPVTVRLRDRETLHERLMNEPWLGWIAADSHSHRMEQSLAWIWGEYADEAARLGPKRPRVNFDSRAYDVEVEVNDRQELRRVRQLAYASLFAVAPAGLGYTKPALWKWQSAASSETFGDLVTTTPAWFEALEDESSYQMGKIETKISKHLWRDLVPAPDLLPEELQRADPLHRIGVLTNSDRSMIRVYVPEKITFGLPTLDRAYTAYWVDLRALGSEADVQLPLATSETVFEPPNNEGWILELDEA